MPSISGYAVDVFVSYAHADNESSELRQAWVSRFVADLEISLAQRLGTSPTIYFDVRRLTSGVELAQLLEHARKAAIFLAIVSPSYVARDWTRDELKSFLSTHGSSARLCPVEVLPLDNETEYPAEFVKVKRVNFWFSPGEAGTPVTIQADLHAEKYYDRLQDLAFDLRRRLKEIAADRPVATREMPTAAPKTDKSTTALLAQVTDDLEDDRNDVRRHLEQFGVRVLPSNAYPQGGADFRAAFAADCAQANLFVQLLGPVGSRHPPDLAASYATTQYDLAKQQGLERKLWRRPDLKLELIKHRDVLLLYAPETEAIGLEAFKSDLVRHLTTPPTPPRNRPAGGGGIIFINADPSDLPLAESIYQEMRKGLYSAALPYFKGTSEEIRLDLEGSLVDCSALVLVYGSVTPVWVRGQLRLFEKLRPRRDRPPHLLVVYAGPPEQKPDLGLTIPDVRLIDARKEASLDKVIALVRDMI